MPKYFKYKTLDQTTLDNLSEGCQLISYDWRYLYVNEAVIKQSKYENKEDLLGYTMMEKYPGIDETEMFEQLKECMDKRVPSSMINEFTYPDNSKAWFELHIEPVPRGIFILSMDISERKKAELAKINYVNSLEEMLFIVSHKVRSPVCSIIGLLNLIDHSDTKKKDMIRISNHLKSSINALDTFTKELTTFIHEKQITIHSDTH